MIEKTSPWSVQETVDRLRDVIAAKGAKVFAVVDHAGEARGAGLELRDTQVVIFGSPVAGTPIMEDTPLAALDLPLKVLVWRDRDITRLNYLAPAELAERYGFSAELAGPLGAIDAVTDAATGVK